MGIPSVLRVKVTSQRFLHQISRLPFHIGFKIRPAVIYIYIYMLAFCRGDPTLRTSRIELRLNSDSTTL